MQRCLFVFALSSLLCTSVHSKTANEWKSRIIYQLLTDRFASGSSSGCSDLHTYCGGTFKGITNNLDYIQGLGANAIWISPIPVNTPGGYHGYWAMDITKVNPYFGSEDDLKELINECHKRDIWVMLDVWRCVDWLTYQTWISLTLL
ncbi:uncharacterized protein [Dysidea avara]|uniref:uncharacterized protein n=1 Tax=Dysidea avara TaxID=196820 RepID=UPI0033196BC9